MNYKSITETLIKFLKIIILAKYTIIDKHCEIIMYRCKMCNFYFLI
jgi:hypothetical protein